MVILCPACLHLNDPGSLSCVKCSQSFANRVTCAACSATVFAFSRYCYQCGGMVQTERTLIYEITGELDPSTNMLTGDILEQEGDESLATTFHRHGVRLLHRPTSVFYDLPLLSSPISIGKRSDSFVPDLDFRDLPEAEFISRNHAQISFSPQKFYIEDLDSKNGTMLNGVPLPPAQPQTLTFGDHICFGGSEAFEFIFIKDQPINLEHLRMISGNDRAFELELLTSYKDSVTNLLNDLHPVIERQAFGEVKPLASQVAIASYNVGADVMNLLAKQMEDQALQQAMQVCEKTLNSLREGLMQIDLFMKVFYGT